MRSQHWSDFKSACLLFFLATFLCLVYLASAQELLTGRHDDGKSHPAGLEQGLLLKERLELSIKDLNDQIAQANVNIRKHQAEILECPKGRDQQANPLKFEISRLDAQLRSDRQSLQEVYNRIHTSPTGTDTKSLHEELRYIQSGISGRNKQKSDLEVQINMIVYDRSCESFHQQQIKSFESSLSVLAAKKSTYVTQLSTANIAANRAPSASLVNEAPWGGGKGPKTVSPNNLGLAPQPGATKWETDQQRRARIAAEEAGTSAGGPLVSGYGDLKFNNYIKDFSDSRAASGQPIPPDFFDEDPAIVKYDGQGNGVDAWGMIVEYPSESARRAAIIEARASAAEWSARQARDSAEIDYQADLRKQATQEDFERRMRGEPSPPRRSYDSSMSLDDAFEGYMAAMQKVQANMAAEKVARAEEERQAVNGFIDATQKARSANGSGPTPEEKARVDKADAFVAKILKSVGGGATSGTKKDAP